MIENIRETTCTGQYIDWNGDSWYRISHCDLMPEFFMSLVSSSDHWMFVSSKGAITAGRSNSNLALFPYYSADKLSDLAGCTGPRTLIRLDEESGYRGYWEPWANVPNDGKFTRNLYKNIMGNRICFEEIHHELELCFRYSWSFGQRFGFIRQSSIENLGYAPRSLVLLDGLENLVPCGIEEYFQLRYSNLADAYKKNELLSRSGLGVFYLSSIPTDRAEPSEGLRATTVWQRGLDEPTILLTSRQIASFRSGQEVQNETDVRGLRGAYLVAQPLQLEPQQHQDWLVVADVSQDHTDVVNLDHWLGQSVGTDEVVDDIKKCSSELVKITSAVDGRQTGNLKHRTHRHQTNVMFNVMRGGLPAHEYQIDGNDFRQHVRQANRQVFGRCQSVLNEIGVQIEYQELVKRVSEHADPDLLRIALEYLPLTFSRRHGDPTRPWNSFSIASRNDDGSRELNYEGNWRDIFQNWEALAFSYPRLSSNMIFRFVNASTADGYNPYRINKEGFEWEEPNPGDSWSNIGYWCDHQIIYLLKLLEWSHRFQPSELAGYLNQNCCVYADVPYQIRSYEQMLQDPMQTIDFHYPKSERLKAAASGLGADGKLLKNQSGDIHRVTLAEKLLLPLIVKMTNFVPDGGIWLNTQRPEWNDANNALVGKGLSLVTVGYLRRFVKFLSSWLAASQQNSVQLSREVGELLLATKQILERHSHLVDNGFSDRSRRQMVDGLSQVGSNYRQQLYRDGFDGQKRDISVADCLELLESCERLLDATILANRRPDGLFHAYNLLTFVGDDQIRIEPLQEMLEGQVAVLSSGILSPAAAADLLDALGSSQMYRPDQNSFMLYPDRELPSFLAKNQVPQERVYQSRLLMRLLAENDQEILREDVLGNFHFSGRFRNSNDLKQALDALQEAPAYHDVTESERQEVCQLFDDIFRHREFTGRSGTFFAYEGLGSIYWHMVSKLLLAIQENFFWAVDHQADAAILDRLRGHYMAVRRGIADKTPGDYGAFPSDPYSHTPKQSCIQQPGMTGQVKEDILTRFGELGVRIEEGVLRFDPSLFESVEFLVEPSQLDYFDVEFRRQSLPLDAGQFAFTICQVPIIYHSGPAGSIEVHYQDGHTDRRAGTSLTYRETQSLFSRQGKVKKILFEFTPSSSATSHETSLP